MFLSKVLILMAILFFIHSSVSAAVKPKKAKSPSKDAGPVAVKAISPVKRPKPAAKPAKKPAAKLAGKTAPKPAAKPAVKTAAKAVAGKLPICKSPDPEVPCKMALFDSCSSGRHNGPNKEARMLKVCPQLCGLCTPPKR